MIFIMEKIDRQGESKKISNEESGGGGEAANACKRCWDG